MSTQPIEIDQDELGVLYENMFTRFSSKIGGKFAQAKQNVTNVISPFTGKTENIKNSQDVYEATTMGNRLKMFQKSAANLLKTLEYQFTKFDPKRPEFQEIAKRYQDYQALVKTLTTP